MMYIFLISKTLIFIFCACVAFSSSIPLISAIWGFSAGIWFKLALECAFHIYSGSKY
jgi:hypothetical protein